MPPNARLITLGLLAILSLGSAAEGFSRGPASEKPAPVEFDHLSDGTLHFKVPDGSPALKSVKLDLYDLNHLGQIRPETGLPYFIFSGRACQNCIQDKQIYLIRPAAGRPATFVYPGKILEPKTRSVSLESRAFFGQCLRGRGEVLVVFQKEKIERKRRRTQIQQSVLIAEAAEDHLNEKLLERGLPNLAHTLRAVRAKTCQEIEGRNRVMVARPSLLLPASKKSGRVDEREADDDDDSSGDSQAKEGAAPSGDKPPAPAGQ